MSTTIRSLVETIRSIATSSRDQGERFEQLMRLYFLNDPLYKGQFSDVWLWTDWPGRNNEPDTPFPGIVHTDTFTLTQDKKLVEDTNSKRAKKQKEKKIRIIIGNPPYSTGQRSTNDNNQNVAYPEIDDRIRMTYAESSTVANKNSLYDSYIRAFRWSTDRIGDRGIIAFMTNGYWLDGNAMDGFRKCLAEEFTDIYCFNLRGNARTSGEQRRKERDNVFGMGTRTPVAITLMIKNPTKKGKTCSIHYHDIGDYKSREEKLEILRNFQSLENVSWQIITPNDKNDWINQRGDEFDGFVSLGDKKSDMTETIFENYSSGVKMGRDAWCYNFSQKLLKHNMTRMIEFYNEQTTAFQERKTWDKEIAVDQFIDNDPKKIGWDRELKKELEKFRTYTFEKKSIFSAIYRPFCKIISESNPPVKEGSRKNLLKFQSIGAYGTELQFEAKFSGRNISIRYSIFVLIKLVPSFAAKTYRGCSAQFGRDSIVACASIHLFVNTARPLQRDARRNTPTQMPRSGNTVIDDLENIAGPNHGCARKNKRSPKRMKHTALVEFQGTVTKTVRRTNDSTFFRKIFSSPHFASYTVLVR